MTDDIFANLPRQAERLGAPVAYYRDRPGLARLLTVLRPALRLVFGLLILALGVAVYGDLADDPGIVRTALLVLSLLVGASCLVSAARLAWAGRRGGPLRGGNVRGVALCPGGLVCVLPDRSFVASWDDIESIWDGGRRFRSRGVEVVLPDSLEGLGTVAESLYRETFQRMSICASAVLLGGRPVEFGPVMLTREEIVVGDRSVAWPELGRVVAVWGRLRIFRDEERAPALDVALAEIPNVHALWAVMERLREGGFGSIVIGPGASEPPEPDE
jgi:hypothetical protein